MKSGNVINYSLRVGKNIERKMIKDCLLRLFNFSNTNTYQYIGFGSKYFTDFIVFHKYLHIDSMISIEGDVDNEAKYDFNKPLNCIKMMYGHSSEILPSIDLSINSVIWLDFDGLLVNSCLEDISFCISKMKSGSVILTTFNSHPLRLGELIRSHGEGELKELTEKDVLSHIAKKYINLGQEFKGFSKWLNYSTFLQSVVINAINNALDIRNRDLAPEEKISLHQIFYFDYKDGVEMTTLGFIVCTAAETDKIKSCQFEDFEFYKPSNESYKIIVPNLTSKEIKTLVEKMPISGRNIQELDLPSSVFNEKDVESFSKIYKYNPIFNDSEMT
jgi:hypothetical protein